MDDPLRRAGAAHDHELISNRGDGQTFLLERSSHLFHLGPDPVHGAQGFEQVRLGWRGQ